MISTQLQALYALCLCYWPESPEVRRYIYAMLYEGRVVLNSYDHSLAERLELIKRWRIPNKPYILIMPGETIDEVLKDLGI